MSDQWVVNRDRRIDLNDHASLICGFEARHFHCDRVAADRQGRKRIETGIGGRLCLGDARSVVLRRDLRPGYGSAVGVRDCAADARCVRLRPGANRQSQAQT
jgi:hypothetical protein